MKTNINPVQLANLKRIQDASNEGRLVLFVGAGVSCNSGVPTWRSLVDSMKQELPSVIQNETDELKIAQMYKDSRGKKEYVEKVKSELKYNQTIPNPIHKAILALNPIHIITTNYDDLIEQEIRTEFKQYAIIRRDADLPNMAYPNAVIKMHGDFTSGNIVLSENDYYNYSKDFALIRAFVQSLFASKLVVFVGFSFADLNLKLILNEVKHILEEQMQPVYLISLDEPDDVTLKYFNAKAVNVVYFNDVEIGELNKRMSRYVEADSLGIAGKGGKLYNILNLIRRYDMQHEEDLLACIFKKIESYKNEFRVFGRGLKYFFPQNKEGLFWNEFSHGLQTNRNKYFAGLSKSLESYSGRKNFLQRYGYENCKEYIQLAYYNCLPEIDGLTILGDSFFQNNKKKYIPPHIVDYLDVFDFSAFEKRLTELSKRNISCSIADLEYPYAFYKIGDYYQSYVEFKKILPLAWEKGKYILYFTCLYNIKALRFAIRLQLIGSRTLDGDAICNQLEEINLEDTLSRLPLHGDIKQIFQDFLANRYIGSHSVETGQLKEELHKQRKSSERGAVSMNSNITSLIGKYEREANFGKYNFLLSDMNTFFRSVCRNTIAGILNSYATKEGGENMPFQNTRIKSFGSDLLRILIFGASNDELVDMFKQYEVVKLKLDEDGESYMISCFDNLKECNYEILRQRTIVNYFENLLFVIALCDIRNIDVNVLYGIIKRIFGLYNVWRDLSKYMPNLLLKYKPSKEVAIDLLQLFVEYKYDRGVALVADILDSYEYKSFDYSLLSKFMYYDDIIRSVYKVIPDKKRKGYVKEMSQKISSFGRYLEFLASEHLLPVSLDEFKNRLKRYVARPDSNEGYVCRCLAKWRRSKKYSKFWPAIDEYSKKSDCLQFFLTPLAYKYPEKVKAEWFLWCDVKEIRRFTDRVEYADLIKRYVAEGEFLTENQKKRLLAIS